MNQLNSVRLTDRPETYKHRGGNLTGGMGGMSAGYAVELMGESPEVKGQASMVLLTLW